MELEILYADGAVAVCRKPVGVSSEQEGAVALLQKQLGGSIFCVHRLDRAVGGVMVYARTQKAAAALSGMIAKGELEKTYLAVAQGKTEKERDTLRDLLYHDAQRNKSYVVSRSRRGVREAVLEYERLGEAMWEGQTLSLLRIRLLTGRSHQIRVQFASRGLPLVGDGRYGSTLRGGEIALFSQSLRFAHPISHERMQVTADRPEGFPWELFG